MPKLVGRRLLASADEPLADVDRVRHHFIVVCAAGSRRPVKFGVDSETSYLPEDGGFLVLAQFPDRKAGNGNDGGNDERIHEFS